MPERVIYFDNNATTRALPEVVNAVAKYLGSGFGNASSAHSGGESARRTLFEARIAVADLVGASPEQVISLTDREIQDLQQGFDVSSRVLASLAEDHKRNLLLIERIIQSAEQGNQILVFACSVSHANVLADILRIRGYAASSITSETPPDQRARIISKFREAYDYQILTNFGVLTTGFDAPKTNVAFIARPTQSVVLYSQMVGRVARGPRAGGNKECTVFTVQDDIPGFRSIAEGFGYWDDIWGEVE